MRLWLRDDERRPDPTPAQTDDRKAILVGLGLWVIGLVVLLVVLGGSLIGENRLPWLWTDLVGIALGILGLVYLSVNRR